MTPDPAREALPTRPHAAPKRAKRLLITLAAMIAIACIAMAWAWPRLRKLGTRRVVPAQTPLSLVQGRCPAGMAEIPGGTFQFGSIAGAADATPGRAVTIAPFCIDGTEVTVAAYASCVSRGTCVAAPTTVAGPGFSAWDRNKGAELCNGNRADRQEHPVNCVDWTEAERYCLSVGARLPREEEWEYAARGADARMYPWGHAPPGASLLNACGSECVALWERLDKPRGALYEEDDGWETTAPVGSYAAGKSPFGLVDMGGNVWEWTSGHDAPDDPRSGAQNKRLIRGGGFSNNNAAGVRVTARNAQVVTSRNYGVGFRCARTLP